MFDKSETVFLQVVKNLNEKTHNPKSSRLYFLYGELFSPRAVRVTGTRNWVPCNYNFQLKKIWNENKLRFADILDGSVCYISAVDFVGFYRLIKSIWSHNK